MGSELPTAQKNRSLGGTPNEISGIGLTKTKKRVTYEQEDEFDYARAFKRFVDAVVRGAATGFVLRGGLSLVSLLFALVVKVPSSCFLLDFACERTDLRP
jgi:hypothetical protein